jgi:hypothetical protein
MFLSTEPWLEVRLENRAHVAAVYLALHFPFHCDGFSDEAASRFRFFAN